MAEGISRRVGSADAATARKKQGVRPGRKEQTCGWSIRLTCVTSEGGINSWVVPTGKDGHHLADHNHHLDPGAAKHASRAANVSNDIKLEIRLLADHHMKPKDVAHFMNHKYSYLQLTAQDVRISLQRMVFRPTGAKRQRPLTSYTKIKTVTQAGLSKSGE